MVDNAKVPPPVLDGANVLAFADLAKARATGTVRHFRDGAQQDSNGFAYLVLASYTNDSGIYAFYCDAAWEVANDMLYDSREDAEEQLHREFLGVIDV